MYNLERYRVTKTNACRSYEQKHICQTSKPLLLNHELFGKDQSSHNRDSATVRTKRLHFDFDVNNPSPLQRDIWIANPVGVEVDLVCIAHIGQHQNQLFPNVSLIMVQYLFHLVGLGELC
jgi:hypothetical protein